MTKKFFTKASPKAASGIRRVYEGKGYEVRAKLQTDGSVTVVAFKDEHHIVCRYPVTAFRKRRKALAAYNAGKSQ